MKLKICHFVNHITGKSDGVYTHLVMLFKYLDNNKYEQFIVFQGNRKIENEMESLGIKYYVIPSLTKKVPIKSFFQFYKFVKSNHIDIIQTHFLKPYTIGGLTNIFLRKKMIHNYQGLFINNLYNSKLEKIVYRISHMIIYLFSAVDFAIVPSFKSRELLYKETKLFPQIKVYYNGYAPKLNKEFRVEVINYIEKLKMKYIIVGIVARMEAQKRIDLSLNIANKLIQKHKNIFFLYFGDGPLEYEMSTLAYKLGINKNVKFMGFVPNVKYYIKYFDVILFTSDWEGLPLALWEAMASGTPIVSTDVGGINEIIGKENCGIIFPQNSVQEGTISIEKVLFHNELKKKLSQNALLAMESKYSLPSFIKTMESFYNEI